MEGKMSRRWWWSCMVLGVFGLLTMALAGCDSGPGPVGTATPAVGPAPTAAPTSGPITEVQMETSGTIAGIHYVLDITQGGAVKFDDGKNGAKSANIGSQKFADLDTQ